MGMAHQEAEPFLRNRSPWAGVRLAPFFDHAPGIIPPSAVIVGRLWLENLGRGHRVCHIGMHGAEDKKVAADRDVVIEDGLLNVRLARENEDGTNSEWLDFDKVCSPSEQW